MKAFHVEHKGLKRIKIVFQYNRETIAQLRQVADCRWSDTMKSWHIPDTPEATTMLKTIFPQIEFQEIHQHEEDNALLIKPDELSLEKLNNFRDIDIHVTGRNILIRMPKNESDIIFIKNLKYSRWDKGNFCWALPNYPGNLDLLKKYFGDRIGTLSINESVNYQVNNETRTIDSNEVLLIRTRNNSLRLIGLYKKEIIDCLKLISFKRWDPNNKWWTFPYTDFNLAKVRSALENAGVKILFEEEKKEYNGLKRPSPGSIPNYRDCPEEYVLKLKELRYSENTIRTYTDLFREFINYHFRYDIKAIDEPAILAYLRYLVMERQVSTSYQNQAINAIKFYYERVLGGQRKFYKIERPIKEKTLPEVLSKEEITAMISMEKNIKHKAVIMVGFSAGLRVGEIVNLKLSDIDTDRMQLRISQSKGKKDRYVVLSSKTLETLIEYLKEYSPSEWVFEGWKGKKFSSRSVQEIVKDAAKTAGIKKHVTVHTLRHTFATHLLENGTDLRNIQEHMGHESIRTTQIYTHISTGGIRRIKSPLDDLDL